MLAINRGLPVVASRTPSYERLLTECGLDKYLFSSNAELMEVLRSLKLAQERKRYLHASQDIVLNKYSCKKMVDDWYRIYLNMRAMKFFPV